MNGTRRRRAEGLAMMTAGMAGAMVVLGALVQWALEAANPAAAPLRRRVVVSSPFGRRADPFHRRARNHAGVDLQSPRGEPVRAAAAGLVVQAGDLREGRGTCVRLLHPDGRSTVYAHLADTAGTVLLSWVPAGHLIGHVGSTGRSTGPHLHFEVRSPVGLTVDPMPLLAELGVSWMVVPQPALTAKAGRRRRWRRRFRALHAD